jgi:hypothetical protein
VGGDAHGRVVPPDVHCAGTGAPGTYKQQSGYSRDTFMSAFCPWPGPARLVCGPEGGCAGGGFALTEPVSLGVVTSERAVMRA